MGCWFAYSSLDSTFFFAALHHKHCGGSEAKKNETSKTSQMNFLVGGFNPSEKCYSKWESSPNRGENSKNI